MPLYEYICPNCKWAVSVMRTVEQRKDRVQCWHCGRGMEMKVSAPALRFKGQGWQTPRPVEEQGEVE